MTEPHGEHLPWCPECKGVLEEAKQCERCGEWFLEDELENGYCDKCLEETITLDTFLYYAVSDDDTILEDFMMQWVFGYDFRECPKEVHRNFRDALVREYEWFRQKDADWLMNRVREFMKDYKYEYADYLKELNNE